MCLKGRDTVCWNAGSERGQGTNLVQSCVVFFFFSSRRRHTRCREVSWARRCVQETGINAEYMGELNPILKMKDQGKSQEENFDTIKSMMKRIDEYSSEALKTISFCGEEESRLRDEIVKDIHEIVEKENTSVLETLQPTIQQNYKTLKQDIKSHKEGSDELFKQLLNLRKEATSMKLQITACENKVEEIRKFIIGENEKPLDDSEAVSYTHLTLPTILLVQISVVAVSVKKKKDAITVRNS
eukprot:TRINITY_DN3463_c0_g1_i1.p1 TRINITY_DN3463_c0_g1~~TRINITY_DN3463_c0_g1_i1.p1  ORF type:complete len:242 (-),score=84.12 TRINITY_DN3463_c0_g1_i1:18-743(-)